MSARFVAVATLAFLVAGAGGYLLGSGVKLSDDLAYAVYVLGFVAAIVTPMLWYTARAEALYRRHGEEMDRSYGREARR